MIFLGHHGGGYEQDDVAQQVAAAVDGLAATLAQAGAGLEHLTKVTLYLRDIADFEAARDALARALPPGVRPARMTATTDFVDPGARCQIDGIAVLPGT
nr:RidA family protein [Cellulomonas sp. APG4]